MQLKHAKNNLPFSPVGCNVEKPPEVVLMFLAPGLRDALDIVKGLLACGLPIGFLMGMGMGRDEPTNIHWKVPPTLRRPKARCSFPFIPLAMPLG